MTTEHALQTAGRSLAAAARAHKRTAAAHRRQAQEAMRALDQVRQQCKQLGIELILEDDTDPGGQSHARHRS